MTDNEKRISNLEVKLTEVDSRAQSNTKRLNSLENEVHDIRNLVTSIEKIAVEVKYMRNDINDTSERLDRLESKDADKWDKFKWSVLTFIVSAIITYLVTVIGLK